MSSDGTVTVSFIHAMNYRLDAEGRYEQYYVQRSQARNLKEAAVENADTATAQLGLHNIG